MPETRYIETVGRRKTAAARVRMTPAAKRAITVNGKDMSAFFTIREHQSVVIQPLADLEQQFSITVMVAGGGVAAQATAVRHGIARALTEFDKELRIPLKKKGFLMRDPRVKERKKPGLKKARKSPQWSKR
jgi:small subunit ribosomal protein S9